MSEFALSGCLRVITHPKIFKKPTPCLKRSILWKTFVLVKRRIFSGRAWDTGKFSPIFVDEATREVILCRTRSTPRWRSSLAANG